MSYPHPPSPHLSPAPYFPGQFPPPAAYPTGYGYETTAPAPGSFPTPGYPGGVYYGTQHPVPTRRRRDGDAWYWQILACLIVFGFDTTPVGRDETARQYVLWVLGAFVVIIGLVAGMLLLT